MADVSPNTKTDALKRRSTRIVQAVPLTVTGVDALGRPFEERTSTSIINCHGCHYQSKHYVLKNMWVTLEVPHPEQGRPPRNVRARVMWIQRPRTVRELFQVGIEMEVAGNIWGIAFCPPDWFPFPDSESEIHAPSAEAPALPEETLPEAAEVWSGSREPAPAEDNVRTMPMASPIDGGIELSLTLARQMERLLNEAKQQLRAAVRDHAAEAVSAEAHSHNTLELARENLEALRRQAEDSISAALRDGALRLQAQADDARTRMSEIENVLRDSIERIAPVSTSAQTDRKAQPEADTGAAAKRWDDHVEGSIESAAQKVAERLSGTAQAAGERLEKELGERIAGIGKTFMETTADAEGRLAAALASVENQAGYVQALLTQVQEAARPIAERTAQLDAWHETTQQELERRAAALADSQNQELARRGESAIAAWIERLQPSLDSAQQELERRAAALADSQNQELARRGETAIAAWIERLQPSLDSAQQELERRAAALADSQNQELARRGESAMASWIERLQPSLDSAQQELERRATALVDSQNQELARRGEIATASWIERLQPSLDSAQQELERRAAALIEIQSQELARRGEIAISTWTERLQPSLEAAAQETVTRLGAQFERHLGSHLDRAHHVFGRLEHESQAAGEAMRKREEALAAISNRIVEAATAQLQRQIETLERDFQEAGRQAAAQWLAEIDSKATETTHATFESLFKTAEWYEKKVQTHMQAALEKGLEQGADQLRDKAGEISRLFAGELDHYSRSYVEHAHDQMEEASQEALERARSLSTEMASASISALTQQMQSGTDAAMRDFHAKTSAALGKLAAQAEEQAGQTHARIEAAAQRLSIDFSASIKQQAQQAIGSAKLELASQANSASDILRAEADAREKHLREALASASNQGIETYKQRLESAANSWLLTTVSKLNQDSQQQLGTLTRAAEARLRDTCKQVFASVGEALRQQMLDLPVSSPEKKSGDETT